MSKLLDVLTVCLIALPLVILLSLLVDWAMADFYFTRKWWSERPKR